jgi:hypothetical protein
VLSSREALRAKLISSGILGADAYVVLAGPANTYAHYVTTPEEYAAQRYEGASTIFGKCKHFVAPETEAANSTLTRRKGHLMPTSTTTPAWSHSWQTMQLEPLHPMPLLPNKPPKPSLCRLAQLLV